QQWRAARLNSLPYTTLFRCPPEDPGSMLGPQGGPHSDIQIRPAAADDAERVRRFLTGLSLHTQTLRFFAGLSRPAASLVRTLLEIGRASCRESAASAASDGAAHDA